MNTRTIVLPEIFTRKAKLDKWSIQKLPFSFDWSGISDDEMTNGIQALCHKLLCDKLRSKAKQKGSELNLQRMADQEGRINVKLSEFFQRTRTGRISFEDEEPEAIVAKLNKLDPEKLAKIIEALSK